MNKNKRFYVYLYTKSRLKQSPGQGVQPKTKLRVRVIADGRELSAALPLLVNVQFANYYHSDGRLRYPYEAVSIREKNEKISIRVAYNAARAVAKWMTSIPDYWRVAPKHHFAALINMEFDARMDAQEPYSKWIGKEVEKSAAAGFIPSNIADIAEWRYYKGIGPQPPSSQLLADWQEYIKGWMGNKTKNLNHENR